MREVRFKSATSLEVPWRRIIITSKSITMVNSWSRAKMLTWRKSRISLLWPGSNGEVCWRRSSTFIFPRRRLMSEKIANIISKGLDHCWHGSCIIGNTLREGRRAHSCWRHRKEMPDRSSLRHGRCMMGRHLPMAGRTLATYITRSSRTSSTGTNCFKLFLNC